MMRSFSYGAALCFAILSAGCGSSPAGTGGAGGSGSGAAGGQGGASSSASNGSGGASSASTGTGGESSTSSGSGGATSSSASSGTGGASANSGDCDSDADCPGSMCVEITPGGFRVCLEPQAPTNGCPQACASPAKCYAPFGYCGGFVGPMDQCLSDMCSGDSGCGNDSVCIQAAVLGYPVNACAPAYCKHDTDCTAQAGGICAPVEDACCTVIQGLYCVYPNGGCRSKFDCPGNNYCNADPATGVAACAPGGANCPI